MNDLLAKIQGKKSYTCAVIGIGITLLFLLHQIDPATFLALMGLVVSASVAALRDAISHVNQ